MAVTDVLKFAKSVDTSRKQLIDHCKANGKIISDNASLDTAITVNNQINSQTLYKIEWFDIDGSKFKENDYVMAGSSINLPNSNPSFDSDLLEFVRWGTDCNLLNITHDTTCVPIYQVKKNEYDIRPSVLYIYACSDTSMSFNLNFTSYAKSGTTITQSYGLDPIYVDWGDGTIDQTTGTSNTSTSCSSSHTYATEGNYIVKFWANTKAHIIQLSYNSTYGVISTNSLTASLGWSRFYIGEQYYLLSYHLIYPSNSTSKLSIIVLSPSDNLLLGRYAIRSCSINTIIIPNEVRCGADYGPIDSCPNLEHYVVEYNRTSSLSNGKFIDANCYSLKQFYFPEDSNIMQNRVWIGNTSITKFNYPTGTITLNTSNNYSIQDLFIPESITSISVINMPQLNSISIPTTISLLPNNIFSNNNALTTIELRGNTSITSGSWDNFPGQISKIILPQNYAANLYIKSSVLSNDTLYDIALKLAQLDSALTITFSTYLKPKLIYLKIDNISLLTYIQNKNWTVTFA